MLTFPEELQTAVETTVHNLDHSLYQKTQPAPFLCYWVLGVETSSTMSQQEGMLCLWVCVEGFFVLGGFGLFCFFGGWEWEGGLCCFVLAPWSPC